MSEESMDFNPHFLQLVMSLQSAAMFQMGKTASPISGKIERDMIQAKISIDLLKMLQEKTKGNLSEQEKQVIDSTIYNLQMNYVDEVNADKPAENPEAKTDSDEKVSSEPEGASPDSAEKQ